MVEVRASDVHLTPGLRRPRCASTGEITPMDDFPTLTPQDTREIVYSILNDAQRKRFENEQPARLRLRDPGVARFRVNCFFQRGSISAAFRLIPQEIQSLESTRPAAPVLREFTRKPRGFVLVTGPTGSGKSTTLASMVDLINAERRSTSSRSRTRSSSCTATRRCIVNQREIGADATDFATAPARRPARGPRRDPRRRDARPGDDLDRADRGRDRPPRLRHPAHPVDRADGRPDHRRLPAAPAAPGADAALDRAAGDRHPAAAADRRRLGAGRRAARCWCRPRRSAT